jgi:hypothetical protein
VGSAGASEEPFADGAGATEVLASSVMRSVLDPLATGKMVVANIAGPAGVPVASTAVAAASMAVGLGAVVSLVAVEWVGVESVAVEWVAVESVAVEWVAVESVVLDGDEANGGSSSGSSTSRISFWKLFDQRRTSARAFPT